MNTRDFAARLAGAVEERGISVRAFAATMKERGVPGSSYAQVRRYLSGEKELPGADFIAAAAEVLGVRLEWLWTGTGSPQHRSESVAVRDRGKAAAKAFFWTLVEAGFGGSGPAFDCWGAMVEGTVRSAHVHLVVDDREVLTLCGAYLARFVLAPMHASGIDPRSLTDDQRRAYLIGILGATQAIDGAELMSSIITYVHDHPAFDPDEDSAPASVGMPNIGRIERRWAHALAAEERARDTYAAAEALTARVEKALPLAAALVDTTTRVAEPIMEALSRLMEASADSQALAKAVGRLRLDVVAAGAQQALNEALAQSEALASAMGRK